jgi:anti-sigma B factor antagonist
MLEMKHQVDESLKALIVSPKGNLDVFTYQEFSQAMADLLKDGNQKRVIIDLADTEFIASSGWAVLISLAKQLKNQHGRMVLTRMSETIGYVYEVMDIETILPRAPEAKDAAKMMD